MYQVIHLKQNLMGFHFTFQEQDTEKHKHAVARRLHSMSGSRKINHRGKVQKT